MGHFNYRRKSKFEVQKFFCRKNELIRFKGTLNTEVKIGIQGFKTKWEKTTQAQF